MSALTRSLELYFSLPSSSPLLILVLYTHFFFLPVIFFISTLQQYTMASLPQQALTFNDVFEDEDIEEPKKANTVHHIRANSSIMQLKKILGM